MSKPYIHAQSSARIFGGKAKDYLDIHEFIDSSKEAFSDLRHRALTHHPWFISKILPRVFGVTRKNSSGRTYSVVEVGERHVHEDFRGKFIPSAQDFLEQIEMHDWMDNGGKGNTLPPSHIKLHNWRLGEEQIEPKHKKSSKLKNSKKLVLVKRIKGGSFQFPIRPCNTSGAFD